MRRALRAVTLPALLLLPVATHRTVLVVVLLTAVSSCGRGQSGPAAPGASGPYAGQTPPGTTAVLFAPRLVSTAGDQGGVVVFPGGREIYFQWVHNAGGRVTSTIRVTKLVNGSWTSPQTVPFSGTSMDGSLAMHPNGSRLYFQSNRPIDASQSAYEYNIWYVERQGDDWSEARPIGRPINGRNSTGGPSVTADGTMYFTIMDTESGHSEIYRSRLSSGVYQEPERLPDQVNSLFQTCDSYVAPDESFLVFVAFPGVGHSNNPGGLYVSFRDSTGGWSAARDIRPTIASVEGGYATITPDGRYLFFTRRDARGQTGLDVFWVAADALRVN